MQHSSLAMPSSAYLHAPGAQLRRPGGAVDSQGQRLQHQDEGGVEAVLQLGAGEAQVLNGLQAAKRMTVGQPSCSMQLSR